MSNRKNTITHPQFCAKIYRDAVIKRRPITYITMVNDMNELFALLKRSPTLAIGTTVILLLLISTAYFSGKTFGYKSNDKGMIFGFFYQTDEPIRTEKYYGYFKDWGPNKKEYITHEEINLLYFKDSNVTASSSANVTDNNGNLIKKNWAIVGFDTGSRMVLSYKTKKSDSDDQVVGVGTYFLKENLGIYEGKWRGTDSAHNAVIECPYLLTKVVLSDEQIKNNYPTILGQPCNDVTNN